MGSASKMTTFTVKRQMPELVRPARPTPRETKTLSDIDDQEGLRIQMPNIHFYKAKPFSHSYSDPAKVIKEALAETLVFYYPFAGRLKEGPAGKLVVECSGEGVLFIEADADVTLAEFGEQLQPPFPMMEELLYDVPGSDGILHSPLLLIQVTRLRCGGFTLGIRINHTMADAPGLLQFMTTIAEIARGASAPSTAPVWRRSLLNARNPPRVTCVHLEYEDISNSVPRSDTVVNDKMVQKSLFFGPSELSSLRSHLPRHLHGKCSTFDVLTACLWRCRTLALQPHPDHQARIHFPVNARGAMLDPPLPQGFYGNAITFPAAVATAGALMKNPIGYAAELVMKTKASVTEEYIRSATDLIAAMRGGPGLKAAISYAVSDLTKSGFDEVDFGWGKPAYGGPAYGVGWEFSGVASFYIPVKNRKGEKGILVPICLPEFAMERFLKEVELMVSISNVTSAL